MLSVNPSKVRLTQGVGPASTGRINGTLTLMKGQEMCVNATAILEVNTHTHIHTHTHTIWHENLHLHGI